MTSKKNSKILNDMLFNSNLEIINNVGHFHPLESPLEVNDIILRICKVMKRKKIIFIQKKLILGLVIMIYLDI